MMDAIQTLVAKLTKARENYYNLKPGETAEISDAAFDALEDELRRLDPTNDFFKQLGAPAPVNGGWPKIQHTIPMTSLNKVQAKADLLNWIRGLGVQVFLAPAFTIMDKLDGMSLNLRYETRKLVQGATRGDGIIGEDITRNVLLMQGTVKVLPVTINGITPKVVNVRGEVVCKRSDFTAHFPNESNPRNTAAGTAKRQSNPEKAKHLTFIAYQLLLDGAPLPSKELELTTLKALGFQTPRWSTAQSGVEIEKTYQDYIDSIRAGLDYDIDGLVVEVNDAGVRENLGDLNGRPRGATAFKFPHEQKETILRAIRWQVGNSGRITPVAEFDEVVLAGAKVTQASLHNISNITTLAAELNRTALAVGDKVLVSRRNDVIPFVEALLHPANGTPFTTPTECPSCKSVLTRDGEYLICRGLDCDAQAAGAIKRWVSKIDVLHVGDSLIECMLDAGLIADAADLYTVDWDAVASLYMGERKVGGTADKAKANLEAKKTLPLHVIVGSIGIPMIGRSMAKTIVDGGFNSLSKMMKAKISDIAAIPGVGDAKARAFVEGFQARAGLLGKLICNGIAVQIVGSALAGKSFCMTGFRDPSMQDAIERAGGTVKSSVSKGLDYLISQDPSSNSGKAQKAAQYGTKIIGIDDAWAIINGKV